VSDFNFVTARLATGAAISSLADAQQIAAAGVTHILDVTDGGDDTPLFAALPNVHVLWNPTADDGQPKPSSWFATSLAFALPALAGPGAKVYAHCSAGVNRGPSTAYAVMRALGWAADEAEKEIRAARPQVGLAYKSDADTAVITLGYT
jgi:protein-tyrosine phosphatase